MSKPSVTVMYRELLCLLKCFHILTARSTLYDGLLSSYLSFHRNSDSGNIPLINRRSLGQEHAQMHSTSTANVRNTVKATCCEEDDDTVLVEWSFTSLVADKASEKVDTACGLSNIDHFSRIVGGEEAKPGNWPWTVALGYEENEREVRYRCGGTLITRRHVLTAAHCTVPPEGTKLKLALIGVTDLRNAGDGQSRRVKEVTFHEKFNSTTNENDIAVILLEGLVNFTTNIRPACLPISDIDSHLDEKVAFVSGWGTKKYLGINNHVLLWAGLEIFDMEVCKEAYREHGRFPDDRMICAGQLDGSKDACQGDSGGPLVNELNGTYYVVGVVSYGYHCGDKYTPGIYTKVFHYADWIRERVARMQ